MTEQEQEQPLTKADVQKFIREAVTDSMKHDHKPEEEAKTSGEHLVREYEKFCPDCGSKNTDYKKPTKFCEDCNSPQGADAKVCWNCGSDELEEEDED